MAIPKIPENIKKRIVEDEVEIEGRTFKLKAFDPLIGNYVLVKLLTTVLPMGLGNMLNEKAGTEMVQTDTGKMPEISKKDFIELQKDVLSFCYEILPGDLAPIVRENGTYGVSNLTMKIVFQLLISCLAFNFAGFFEENPFSGGEGKD